MTTILIAALDRTEDLGNAGGGCNSPNGCPTPSDNGGTPSKCAAPVPPKQKRGFAVMDRSRVSEISRKGGKAAHAAGTAHEFTQDEAREAGRKGGTVAAARRKVNA
jgi:general stress protein YciG